MASVFEIMQALATENARLDALKPVAKTPKKRTRKKYERKRPAFTLEDGNDSARMYVAGEGMRVIAKIMQRSDRTIRRAITARGIYIRPVGRRPL